MSAQATGWVWEYSPYEGLQLLLHLAIADIVNDAHDNTFWMSTGRLADKARVSRSTAVSFLQDAVKNGLLTVVESGKQTRKPTIYAFEMPALTSATSATSGLVATSATSAISSANKSDTSATGGLASATSAQVLARSDRAQNQLTQETQAPRAANRIQTGEQMRVELEEDRKSAVPPPWVRMKISRAAWMDADCPDGPYE